MYPQHYPGPIASHEIVILGCVRNLLVRILVNSCINYLQPSNFITTCVVPLMMCGYRILQSPIYFYTYLLCVVNSLSCQKTTVNGTAYTSDACTYLDTTEYNYITKAIINVICDKYQYILTYR